MRLFIILNKENVSKIDFNQEDIILSKDIFEGVNNSFTIYDFKINREKEISDYEKQIDLFINQQNKKNKEIFKAQRFLIWELVLTEPHNWIIALDTLCKQYNVDEILIDEASKNKFFVPFYGALGEVNEKLFFKDSDFIPQVLISYGIKNNIKCRVLTKTSWIKHTARILLRRYVLLNYKFLNHLKNHLKHLHNVKIKNDGQNDEPFYVILVRSIVHIDFLTPFIKKLTTNYFLHVGERQYGYGENIEFCKQNEINNSFSEKSFLKITDYVSVLFSILYSLFFRRTKGKLTLQFELFDVNLHNVLNELYIYHYEMELYRRSCERLFRNVKSDNLIVLSTEQLMPYSYWSAKEAKKKGGIFMQVQTTRMTPMRMPSFVYGDKFLFYSNNIKDEFIRLNHNEADKLAYEGFLKYNDAGEKKYEKLNKIIFFSQPYEYDTEKEILDTLVQLSKECNFDLFVKPHPRDDIKRFDKWNGITVLKSDLAFRNYIQDFDLALTRMSSVGLDCLLEGVPIIFSLHSSSDKKIEADYLDRSNLNITYSIQDLIDLFGSYETILENFYIFRKKFISDNDFSFDYSKFDSFVKNIQSGK